MNFFFDRSVGKVIPIVLRQLDLPIGIIYHEEVFDMAAPDDLWLPEVGREGWFVIGHDHSYHKNESELQAIRDYNIGCFYLWGEQEKKWEVLRCFAKAYDKIIHVAQTEDRR